MIVELGHFALILALCLSGAQAFFGLAGAQSKREDWMAVARPAAAGQFLFTAIAFGCLVYAFEQNDFTVLYVASTSNTQLPAIYRFTAIWGAHEGSMLLWLLVHSLWAIAVAAFSKQLPVALISRVLGVMGALGVGYALFILITSNPFERLFPPAIDGRDLNPLLQDPAFLIHPPMLYVGYVGMSVPFAFAMAAMLEGKLENTWARWVRPWTNVAWVFLTIGITLGSWWAYYELGWGGWWFWDPSENAPFIPWLISTALIHSLAVTEKRGLFKSWTLLLAIFPFSLALLGTFIVRSGLLTSVHSFAADPERGLFILGFFALCVGSALVLYAWRAPQFRSDAGFSIVSRESFILMNNALLAVGAAIVLLGTLFPFIIDALDLPEISVGEPWFDAMLRLPMLPLIILLAIGMHAGWKKANLEKIRQPLIIGLVAAIGIAIALPTFIYRSASLLTYVGIACAVWLFISALVEPVSRWRHGQTVSLSMLGMCVAHIGVAVFVLGATVAKSFFDDRDITLSPGQSATVGKYEVRFTDVRDVKGPNYSAVEGTVVISENGKQVAVLHPQKRHYHVQRNILTEAGIHPGWARHLSVSMGQPLGGTENAWSMRLMYRPLLRLVWFGALLMALGGFLAVLDRRYRRATTTSEATAGQAKVVATPSTAAANIV